MNGVWAVVRSGAAVLLAFGCAELDGLTRRVPDADRGPVEDGDSPDASLNGPRDAASDDAATPGDAQSDDTSGFDAGSDVLDGGMEDTAEGGSGDAADSGVDGGSEDGRAKVLGWVEVASQDEFQQQGIVRILGSRKHCSGVLITHHWVLTAAHCLCYTDLGNTVVVQVGGSRFRSMGLPETALFGAIAVRAELHPTYDVALLKLGSALPFKVTPLLYAGIDGSELELEHGRAWGYGPNRLDDVGQPTGAGETLTSAALRIQAIGEVGQQFERPANCDIPLFPERSSFGPLAVPVGGSAPEVVDESDGGPLFVGGDEPSTRVLVGILKGTTAAAYAFTGIWAVRDWILEVAGDVSPRESCSEPLPSSEGMSKPAVAEGPGGALHVVAVRDDGTIHHWQRQPDGTLSGPAAILDARTDLRPGLGAEFVLSPAEPVTLGLVFRDAQTKVLKYARWTQQTAWSAAITVPGTTNAQAVALADGGNVGFVAANGSLGGFVYWDGSFTVFPTEQLPNLDLNRNFSTYAQSTPFGLFIWHAYRTIRNEWAEIRGALHSTDGGDVWMWTPLVRAPVTDWQQAVLVGNLESGGFVVATRAAGPSSTVEHVARVMSPTDPGRFIPLGSNRLGVNGEIAASLTRNDDVWVASKSLTGEPNGLMLRRSTDCFANDW